MAGTALAIEGFEGFRDLPPGLHMRGLSIEIDEPSLERVLKTPSGTAAVRFVPRCLQISNSYCNPWMVRGFRVVFTYSAAISAEGKIGEEALSASRVISLPGDSQASPDTKHRITAATERSLFASLTAEASLWLHSHQADIAKLGEERQRLLRLRHQTLTEIHVRALAQLGASYPGDPERFDAKRVETALRAFTELSPAELALVVHVSAKTAIGRVEKAL